MKVGNSQLFKNREIQGISDIFYNFFLFFLEVVLQMSGIYTFWPLSLHKFI